MQPGDVPIGPPRPTLVLASSSRFRWAVFAQAQEDTNHDGVVALQFVHHGDVIGDERSLRYFDPHHPSGIAIDAVVDVSPGQHRVAVAIDGELLVFDALRGIHWSAGPIGPWPTPTLHMLGARRDAVFIDDERVVVLSTENQLEVRDATGSSRAIASIHRSPLSRVDVSAGWAFVRVTSEDDFTWAESAAMYDDLFHGRQRAPRRGYPLQSRDYRHAIEGADVQWWAVHIESGLTVELGDGVGWPAAWGLVKRRGDGQLSLVLLDGSEVVVAPDCAATDFVVPGIHAIGVVHECGSRGISWVGADGVPHDVTVHSEGPATTEDLLWRRDDQVVRAVRLDGTTFSTSAGAFFLLGESVLVAPDARQIWLDDRSADGLGHTHDQREAPNGFLFVDTVRARDGRLYRRGPDWLPVPDPVREQGCMDGYEIAPALWGRCVSAPAEPGRAGLVDAEGWALVTRGEWGTCSALGPVQPVWARLLDVRAESSEPPPDSQDEPEPEHGATPSTWLDTRYAWRSLTLPRNTFRVGASGRLGRNPTADGAEPNGSLTLGVAYGITDFVEVGIDADRVGLTTPVLTDPRQSEGALSWNAATRFEAGAIPLYARLHLAHHDDTPSQVIDAAVEFGVRVPREGSASAWAAIMMRANLPISPFSFDVALQLELDPDGAIGGPRFDLWLPFATIVQVSDRFFLVGRTGLRWVDRDVIAVPLGLEVGATLQRGKLPLVDLTLAFGFPVLLALKSEGDPAPTDTWQFAFGARVFLGP